MSTMLQLLLLTAMLLAHPVAAADPLPSVATPAAPALVTAPCEYKWTFSFRKHSYGIEQYGPVATYKRNTLFICRNQAHLLPVTVPGLIVIAAIIIALPVGLFLRTRCSQPPK
jgi:hypothetical protein